MLVASLLSGCAAGPRIEKVKPQYELVTVEEQAREEVVASPTRFFLDFAQDPPAWERTHVFFDRYTSRFEIEKTEGVPAEYRISAKPSALENFIYRVRKEPVLGGYQYSVSCEPRSQAAIESASMNARNLARFIRDGKLEVSLLSK